jgi:ribosome-binding protein aMBF1 (putative translation factor)
LFYIKGLLGILSRGLISVNLPSYGMAKPSPTHAGNPILVALGDAIRRARLEQGISQEGLALGAGLDRSYVGGIERGEHNLTVINVVKLAEALGLTSSELLRRGGH